MGDFHTFFFFIHFLMLFLLNSIIFILCLYAILDIGISFNILNTHHNVIKKIRKAFEIIFTPISSFLYKNLPSFYGINYHMYALLGFVIVIKILILLVF